LADFTTTGFPKLFCNIIPKMIGYKCVLPKCKFVIQKWPQKNEFIDFSNIKISKIKILQVPYFKFILIEITQTSSILCLQSSLEGILNL
jgi:hypothetical protein